MQTDQSRYLETLLKLYLGLPETPSQASPYDIRLAYDLYQRRIGFEIVEAALLLASVRRLFRDSSLPALPPIRSLNYFIPVISEISANPLPPAICATFVISSNPTSPEIRPRTEPVLSPPRHSARSVIFFHFHVAVNRYNRQKKIAA